MTRLEKTANIFLILACALVIGNMTRNFYLSYRTSPRVLPNIPKGAVVRLPGDSPGIRQSTVPTLVMAISKRCHFCQESVGFYQKLTAMKRSTPQGLRFVAVMPDSKEEAESYLKEQDINADVILSMPVSQIGVKGTPTLLLLDRDNKLEEMWVGKLSRSQETQVMSRVSK